MANYISYKDFDDIGMNNGLSDVDEYYPNHPDYDKCSKHNMFKTIFGCYICKRN